MYDSLLSLANIRIIFKSIPAKSTTLNPNYQINLFLITFGGLVLIIYLCGQRSRFGLRERHKKFFDIYTK